MGEGEGLVSKLMDTTEKLTIQRIAGDGRQDVEDVVIREMPLTIILDNQELVTLLCSPPGLDYLAAGFLFSEGLIKSREQIKRIMIDGPRGVVRVDTEGGRQSAEDLLFKRLITSGCGRGASFYSAADVMGQAKVESETRVSAAGIFALVKQFQQRSEVYRTTGGVHSAALCDSRDILLFNEDIGRHNAIDKVFGECLLKDLPADGLIAVTSGRVSSEVLLKVVRRNIPVLVSRSAPTSLGVKLAGDLGVTLVGFVRGTRMNVYANGWRITTDAER
ncbi:MAG: formate dehydrogenase accessory sulfurtransferase FdhD [Chloroflexota bacterium]